MNLQDHLNKENYRWKQDLLILRIMNQMITDNLKFMRDSINRDLDGNKIFILMSIKNLKEN
jgi:hypothetical protein